MKTKKKRLAGLLTLVMVLSLMYLPGGMVAEAASDSEQVNYFIYFDADKGVIYKVTDTGIDVTDWTPSNLNKYTGDSSISCNGKELTLHDFHLFPLSCALVIKGDAVLKLDGDNVVEGDTQNAARYGIYTNDNLSIVGEGNLSIDSIQAGIYVGGNLTVKDATVHSRSATYGVDVKKNLTMESGSVTGEISSYSARPNIVPNLYSVYGVNADGDIEVRKGTLTGSATGGDVATGIYAGGDITLDGGTLTGISNPSQSSTSTLSYAVQTHKTLTVNGGTLLGNAKNSSTMNAPTYGVCAGQAIELNNSIEVEGGRDEKDIYPQVHIIQGSVGNYYVSNMSSALICRYIKFTTPVSGIGSTSPSNPNVVIGGSTDLDATVIPENASDQTIKWESSDDTIASVDDNGKVTGHKPGTVTITATTEDGEHMKEFTVTVSKKDGPAAPTGIKGVAPTREGGSDGKLVGVNPTLEYSTNKDFTDAKDCTGNEVTGLPCGIYYVRVKETDTTKASAATEVAVNGGPTCVDMWLVIGGTGSGDPKTDQAVADGLGVSENIARQIIDEASKLGVSTDTLLITDASIKGQKSDADLKGSTFGLLKARTTNLKKNSVTVKWDKVKDADGYILYGNKCGKKNAYKHIKTFTKNSTVKYTQKKLKKGTYYKYLVVAYKNIEGVKVTIAASKTVHATTKGGKYGVAKSVKINKTSKKLAVSKTFKIKASEVKLDKKIRQHREIKYESDNSNIATVNNKGVVKAKQKGTCNIYVYAQNGVYKKIKITVK